MKQIEDIRLTYGERIRELEKEERKQIRIAKERITMNKIFRMDIADRTLKIKIGKVAE